MLLRFPDVRSVRLQADLDDLGEKSGSSRTLRTRRIRKLLVTSAGEVLRPSAADFIQVLLNQILGFGHLLRLEADVPRELDCRIDAELHLAVGMLNMHVRAELFAREEIDRNPFARNTSPLISPVGLTAAL